MKTEFYDILHKIAAIQSERQQNWITGQPNSKDLEAAHQLELVALRAMLAHESDPALASPGQPETAPPEHGRGWPPSERPDPITRSVITAPPGYGNLLNKLLKRFFVGPTL